MKFTLRALVLIICAAQPLATTAATDTAPIPVATFFKKSATTGAELSPNGRFVAVRKLSPQGRTMLAVIDLIELKSRAIVNFNNADIDLFRWLNDQRLAFTLINVDHEGDAGKSGLYAIDRDGKNRFFLSQTIVRKRSFSESDLVDHNYPSQHSLHGFPLSKGEAIDAIETDDGVATLLRLNVHNGRQSRVKAPYDTYGWLTDVDGNTRIATAKRGSRVITFYFDKGDWRQIDNRDEKSESNFDPLLYVDDTLYVSSRNGKDEAHIYRYDLTTNALVPQPLIAAPGFDTNGYFIVSDNKMLGFRFTTDAEVTVWFDQQMKAIQQEVDQLLPGTVNNISRGHASETPYVLIDTYSDLQNHAYILYNTETKKRTLLGKTTPEIAADQMAQMTMVRYKARDGLQIPAFLTLPNATGQQQKLPTVVLVGAQAGLRSGKWEWSAEVQFLASRGYAVLQPEPRGVDGFGRAHFQAGIKQTGRASQDDIVDAVKWAVAEGHTDPARVCVAGTGYGGYAAMMGLLRDADTFKCGINWSGLTTYQNNPDDDKLKSIKLPLLLAYGTDDEAVSYKQGLALYQAIKAGNPHAEWLEYTSTVDDWKTQKNRIDLWRHIESFLMKQIGAK
ncbi:prolyl oligopeptidase family serine peptidase [Pseudoduganella sp. LjRoot289]|uniref:alpha/beta hydrolase family protein n=1 Tax=Pseudoduganella sp. LjRoot289 TaxID=3342314 RepID=UPI003ECD0790